MKKVILLIGLLALVDGLLLDWSMSMGVWNGLWSIVASFQNMGQTPFS